ncbi:hypothetical protein [Mycolicibacterium mageritense]|uniref:Uncharacterized protein n=1 Tax=Mycolicibacterium mageritense TaxID=53462 RepID=A0AAI8XPP3_MYCME|nr:hypothetical protein [Mycolicibacterium mageritense]BDY30236.1 hypothetical protein hbim_04179 [Mycolicibacterium mageritense]
MKIVVAGGTGLIGATAAARYFGAVVDERSLLPGPRATVFATGFADWPAENTPAAIR